MAEPEVRIATGTAADDSNDVKMQGEDVAELGETGADDAPGEEDETMTAEAEKPAPRVTFVDYLQSPVITLIIGSGPEKTTLSAHQALLTQS
ncbi:hypothetical protein P7C71_g4000, partial [Lecanoromycetidae sp. Uapishka_2]